KTRAINGEGRDTNASKSSRTVTQALSASQAGSRREKMQRKFTKRRVHRVPFASMHSRSARTFMAAACAFAAIASLEAQQITTKDVSDGFANAQRWLSYSGDYNGQRFSP